MRKLNWFFVLLFIINLETFAETKIITSFYPMHIIALNLLDGVPGINLKNLTGPQSGCLHDYQLTPEDVKTLESGQIFIVNGAGMESFLDKVSKQYPKLNTIIASQGIKPPGVKETHHHEHKHKHKHEETNPHMWVSISLYQQQITNVKNQLVKALPDHVAKIEENFKNYLSALEKLKTKMHKEIATVTNKNIITFHEAFPYFAHEFGLNIVAVIEAEPGAEPSAKELKEIIEKVKKHKIKSLFVEPQYSPQAAVTIARETGASIYTLDPAVTGPIDKNAYLVIMEKNLLVLKEALR